MRNIKSELKKLRNNKGSTMVETLVSFVVLFIIMGILTSAIFFASELKMKASDIARIQSDFNRQIYQRAAYKNETESYKVEPDETVMAYPYAFSSFNLVEKDTETPTVLNLGNVKATGFVSIDPSTGYSESDSDNSRNSFVIAPKVIVFKYKD